MLCGVIACTPTTPVKPYGGLAQRTEAIYVISGGWHTELGLPLEALFSGSVIYRPDPVEPPAEGNLLICCSQPQGDIALDL
jgi:hypothetical protein